VAHGPHRAVLLLTIPLLPKRHRKIQENTHFGNSLAHSKQPQTFRGISCQLGGLPINPNDPKYKTLVQSILERHIDVVAFQEIGINFNRAGPDGTWKKRLGWNSWLDGHRAKTVNAWNSQDSVANTAQFGGVGILALGKTSFYAAGSSIDPKKLGRWCWTRYKGKANTYLRFVSFYRPGASTKGEHSVAAIQRRCLQDMDDNRAPRLAFLEDLQEAIAEWTAVGDAIILCGDLNQDDILSNEITTFFQNVGLRNLIFSRHDSGEAPAMYYHNHSNVAVDGIWAPPCIEILKGGYLPTHEIIGDHRPIWFELSYNQAFGHALPPLWNPRARHLQMRDPRCVLKYNKLFKQALLAEKLPQRVNDLEAAILNNSMTPAQRLEAWDIDAATTESGKGLLQIENGRRTILSSNYDSSS
jgi:exonuclease III